MKILKYVRKEGRPVVANLAAQLGALVCLGAASVVIARTGGPAAVGNYSLLRLLPWLVGRVLSCGMPSGVAFFLAGASRDDPRLRPTIIALTLAAGAAGTAIWILAAHALRDGLFHTMAVNLIVFAGLAVFTQLIVTTTKACLQGEGDMTGMNWAILLEEFTFIPAFVIAWVAGLRGTGAIIFALVAADMATTAWICVRLARHRFFVRALPSLQLARQLASFGARSQVGDFLWLTSLRLDFAFVTFFAGPVILGIYAVASRVAELLRLIPVAFTWVLFPSYAKDGKALALPKARALLPRATLITVVAAVPLAVGAYVFIPIVYGPAFRPAVLPTEILICGLATIGVTGVIGPFLRGTGRPGLESLTVGAGAVLTLALDVVLIPRHHAAGAAVASSAAYLTTTALLLIAFRAVQRSQNTAPAHAATRGRPQPRHSYRYAPTGGSIEVIELAHSRGHRQLLAPEEVPS
jgi:O-antigen/teichoic acid export membrane protein